MNVEFVLAQQDDVVVRHTGDPRRVSRFEIEHHLVRTTASCGEREAAWPCARQRQVDVTDEDVAYARSMRAQKMQQRLGLSHADGVKMSGTDRKGRVMLEYDDTSCARFCELSLEPGEALSHIAPAAAARLVCV